MENNETMVDSRVYEISFIFDNKLDETQALEKANALKQSIASFGGSFISEEEPYMRELAYEMIRVVNNVNTRFNEGYFGWIKFDGSGDTVKSLEKMVKDDPLIIRYLVVKTVKDNTVYTKRAPVIKAETVKELAEESAAQELVGKDESLSTDEGDKLAKETEEKAPEIEENKEGSPKADEGVN